MKNYDFTQDLSPVDFELLSKDLLEKHTQLRFENFRDGKDGGIDLRHSVNRIGQANIVVQCKRFAPDAFSRLCSVLKSEELPKLQRMQTIRYILCTSVSLSPQNVDALVALLAPHVQSPDDIFGRERLNVLLAEHSDIERRHIKLWIGNAGLLESFINPRGQFITQEELTRAARSAKVYVHNESLARAQAVLDKESICVISGNPGIGKTTLAHMLMLSYAKRGFEIVKIESNIGEVRGVAFHEKPTFYLYDDFLGQNSREQKLEKNEDQKIIDFIHSVRKSRKSVFVMTTRDYLLRQSQRTYEKLDHFNFSPMSCVIEIADYTRENRALIVYNHVAFSNIAPGHIEAFVTSRVYVVIMKHPHFNPRIIQFITDERTVADIASQDYPAFCTASLDNPAVIWQHAFQQQLSPPAQDLIICLSSFGARILLEDLRVAFDRYHPHRCRRQNRAMGPYAFASALKELAGNFITVTGQGPESLVEFHNPSIQDYATHEINAGGLYDELIEMACFFEQAHELLTMLRKANPSTAKAVAWMCSCIRRMQDLMESPTARLHFLRYLDGKMEGRRVQRDELNRLGHVIAASDELTDFINEQIDQLPARIADGNYSAADYFMLMHCLGEKKWLRAPIAAAVLNHLASAEAMDIEEMYCASEVIEQIRSLVSEEQLEPVISAISVNAASYAESIEASVTDNPDTLRDDVRSLARIGQTIGIDLSREQDAIEAKAKEIEENAGEPDSDDNYGTGHFAALPRDFTDRDADALFRTLGGA